MKHVGVILIFLLTTTLGYCQNGSTIKRDSIVKSVFKQLEVKKQAEYPKRILYKGMYVTLFTDTLISKMNEFRIDYAESFEIRDSLVVQNFKLENLADDEHKEKLSLRLELQVEKDLNREQDIVINFSTEKILGLEKNNKKLRRKTGFLGGVVVVLAVVTTVIALK